jgi:hypothetical protein
VDKGSENLGVSPMAQQAEETECEMELREIRLVSPCVPAHSEARYQPLADLAS